MKTDIKFAVGQRNGLKSSIWTISTNKNKNDIYISAGILTNETKISLHESGAGQWSYRSEVWKNKDRPNQERHITGEWNFQISVDLKATNIFRIKIPHTELTNYPTDDSKKGIKWVAGLISGTYQFDLCLTPISKEDPTLGRTDLPHLVLDRLQLPNKRWLIVFYQTSPEILIPKVEILQDILSQSMLSLEDARGMCLFGNSDDGVPIVIESTLKEGI